VEGLNKSAIARVQRIAWNTVHRWLEKAGDRARRFNDQEMAGPNGRELQADEIRTIVTGKQQPIWVFAAIEVSALVFDRGRQTQLAEHVNHSDRTVRVHRASSGKKPSWGGYIPQMLSFELCQQIRKILTDESEYPYINDALAVELKAKREERGKSLRGSAVPVESFPGGAHIWTFAGGRINHTIRSIFALVGGLKVISDNFQLRLEGGNATLKAISDLLISPGKSGLSRKTK